MFMFPFQCMVSLTVSEPDKGVSYSDPVCPAPEASRAEEHLLPPVHGETGLAESETTQISGARNEKD